MGKVVLSNGVKLSDLCFGTGITELFRYGDDTSKKRELRYYARNYLKDKKQFHADRSLPKMINLAMNNGINMFDCSRAYGGSEYVLGRELKRYNRNSYIIVTKLSNTDQLQGTVREGFEKSLSELKLEYIDLYLMHWPVTGKYIDSWKILEDLYKEGQCKAIGVCNCNIHHLQEIQERCEITPMVNEFECHPLFTQNRLRRYCSDNGIQVMAYTSTARNDERFWKTSLVPIAKKYNKSITQIILKWHQQIGNIPIVNTYNESHLMEISNINDFTLSDDEIESITGININSRLRYDPDNCDFTQL